MLNANATCQVSRLTGTDLYGKSTTSPPVNEQCAVVRMKQLAQQTPIRAEASGTKGHAWEFIQQNRILLAGNTSATMGSRIDLLGMSFRVIGLSPVVDTISGGVIDHYEVVGDVWA